MKVPRTAERGRLDVDRWIDSRSPDEEFHLSTITASELLHGVHRAVDPSAQARRAAFVEAIIDRLPILPLDLPVARSHARLWAELAAAGRLIGSHDLWLAASCIVHGLSLVTADRREFDRVPGLIVDIWNR